MRINTNISAITANNSLQKAQDNLSASIQRLSSGYKINSSADDPAGCAISEKMRLQIRGLNQADNNSADGESVLNTAEGALQEINAMLTRMKELTVQAANDVNSVDERQAIQLELDSINSEIDRITSQTEFNTQPLLNGNLSRRVYSATEGVNVTCLEVSDNYTAGNYKITVENDPRQAIVIGASGIDDSDITEDEVGTVTINGYEVGVKKGESIDEVISNIMDGAEKAGARAFAANGTSNDTKANGTEYAGYEVSSSYGGANLVIMTKEFGSNTSMTVTCSNAALAAKLGLSDTSVVTDTNPSGIVAKGSDAVVKLEDSNGDRTGFADSASVTADGKRVTVTDINGRKFQVDLDANIAGTQFTDTSEAETTTVTNGTTTTTKTVQKAPEISTDGTETEVEMELTDIGTMSIHVGANQDQVIVLDIPAVTAYTLGIDNINVMTSMTSQEAIQKVDDAVNKVNAVRSKIGAYSNRFEHTRANLSVSSENAESALSTMMDTDMAEEMTTYTSLNVLTQAATSILAQANERPSTVLQILQ